MKIYWRSKEGISAPPDAQFSLWPFGSNNPLPIQEVLQELPLPSPAIRVKRRVDLPNRSNWKKHVKKALREIEAGRIQKVVLARETTLHLAEIPDPFEVAAALQKKAEGASLFCVEFSPGHAFLGATPERLFKRQGQTIETEAIAGTRKKGQDHELLASEKDLREFRFVQEYLEETLTPFCVAPPQFSPIHLHQTAHLIHLRSHGFGELQFPFDDPIVKTLHPSPALCGTPKQDAFAWIQKTEPFTRLYYGGVIGWSTQQESDWMVAIRCCSLEGSIAKIYTGTGIVAGSDPDTEWEELEAKFSLYREIFLCGN